MRHAFLLVALSLVSIVACTPEGPPYDLELVQQGAVPGTDLHVAVVQSGGPVLVSEWAPIARDEVDETFAALLAEGVAYDLYVFEDLDHNGNCDARDHAWYRQIAPATGAVTIDLGTLALDATACTYFTSP